MGFCSLPQFIYQQRHSRGISPVSESQKAPSHSALVVLGAAAVAGAFTEKLLKDMAAFNERPIVFALSNPTSKAECTAEQCYRLTEVLELSVLRVARTVVPGGQTVTGGIR